MHLKTEMAINKLKKFSQENDCEFLEFIKMKRYNKVKFRCGCGKEHSRSISDFYKYPKCVQCANKNRFNNTVNNLPDSLDGLLPLYVREVFYNNGAKLLDESNRPLNDPFEFYCKCGRVGKKRWVLFKKKPCCAKCGKKDGGFQVKERHYKWIEDRRRKEFQDKFREDCVSTMRRIVKNWDSDYIIESVGYSGKDLKEHFLNHPDYTEDFTVDHIFPISAFMEHNIFDFKLVNSLKNIRPLSRSDNCKKYNKYSKTDFYRWLGENFVD